MKWLSAILLALGLSICAHAGTLFTLPAWTGQQTQTNYYDPEPISWTTWPIVSWSIEGMGGSSWKNTATIDTDYTAGTYWAGQTTGSGADISIWVTLY